MSRPTLLIVSLIMIVLFDGASSCANKQADNNPGKYTGVRKGYFGYDDARLGIAAGKLGAQSFQLFSCSLYQVKQGSGKCFHNNWRKRDSELSKKCKTRGTKHSFKPWMGGLCYCYKC